MIEDVNRTGEIYNQGFRARIFAAYSLDKELMISSTQTVAETYSIELVDAIFRSLYGQHFVVDLTR